MEKNLLWTSRPDTVGDHEVVMLKIIFVSGTAWKETFC